MPNYMNITSILRTTLVLALIFLLGACSNDYNSSHQSDGDKLVAQLHQAFQQGHWDDLKKVYSAAYLAQNSTQMVRDHWQHLIKKYGKFKNFSLRNKQKDARLQGEFYMYRYALHFEHGIVGESITVFRSGQDESITISGHRLTEDH